MIEQVNWRGNMKNPSQVVRGYKRHSSSVVFHRSIWPQTLRWCSTYSLYTNRNPHIKPKKAIDLF